MLSDVTKDHFYMKEIKATNPDNYQQLVNEENSIKRVQNYINSF